MATTYTTRDGDMLDEICFKFYGKTDGTVERVLEANQNLANLGPVYSAGVVITMPDVAIESQTKVRLWE